MNDELTKAQLERQDLVDNAIHVLLEDLAGKELNWNQEWIADVRDVIAVIFEMEGIMSEYDFYPWIEISDEEAASEDIQKD